MTLYQPISAKIITHALYQNMGDYVAKPVDCDTRERSVPGQVLKRSPAADEAFLLQINHSPTYANYQLQTNAKSRII